MVSDSTLESNLACMQASAPLSMALVVSASVPGVVVSATADGVDVNASATGVNGSATVSRNGPR